MNARRIAFSCIALLLFSTGTPAQVITDSAFRYEGGPLRTDGGLAAAWNPTGAGARTASGGVQLMFWGRARGCAPLAENGGVAHSGLELFQNAESLTGVAPDRRSEKHWTPSGEHPQCPASVRAARGYSFIHVNESGRDGGIGLFTFTGPKFNSSEPAFWQARGEEGQSGKGANRHNAGTFAVFRLDWRNGPTVSPWSGAGSALAIESRQSVAKLVLESSERAKDKLAQAKQEVTLGFINAECMRNERKTGGCQIKILFNLAVARSGVKDWSGERWFYGGKVLIDRAQGGVPVVFGPLGASGEETLARKAGGKGESLSLWTSRGAPTQFAEFKDKTYRIDISFAQFRNSLRMAAAELRKKDVAQVADGEVAAQFGSNWSDPRAWKLLTVTFGQEVHNPDERQRAYIGGALRDLTLAAR